MLPNSVELDVNEAVIDQSYNATCLATGYPAPDVSIWFDCYINYTVQSTRIDNYTIKMVILINEFSADCSEIYCHSYPITCRQAINHTMNCTTLHNNTEPSPTTISIPTNSVIGKSTTLSKTPITMITVLAIIYYHAHCS